MKEKLVIAFSGGRTSGLMAKKIKDYLQDRYEMLFVFANTGKEREETLVFADRCDKYFNLNLVWIEAVTDMKNGNGVSAKVVSFDSAARNGEPFDSMIAKHGIPNTEKPICSRELKTYAIKAYCRQIGWKGYYTAIGIRTDEIDRMSSCAKKERIIYPLISMFPTKKTDVNEFWLKQPFDLEIKSYEGNCDLCWKKSLRKLMTIAKENPKLCDWWQSMESKYENFIPESQKHNTNIQLPNRFFRNRLSISQIKELSAAPFLIARDESKDIEKWKQVNLFELNEFGLMQLKDYEMDTSNGCEESCEAFSEEDL